ncbi:hypothetical protein LY28_01743 [Ruminiclostridium sufflavum DSM 19573]|uniref:Uncharacterized protein n=1 Tax=Ruminiclostridium sufflavum DSM 19573 TaxID=1121337 RepID=A0A318XN18_9FIRM|nr:hypothetical protein [Ruminiclostridium sufflavum]PYG88033.1 hypothetical protein LY28_01743 [Ruminiclostridium sufflavum DSM 19573]
MSNNVKLYEEGQENTSTLNVIIGNIIMILWFAVGTLACAFLSRIVAIIYLTYSIVMIYFVMRKLVCTNCYYYGKNCSMGWGKLASLFFKKGDISKFKGCGGQKLAPVVYGVISIIPIILIIISLVKAFTLTKIAVLVVFLLITVYTNVISRKTSCSKCKMRYECSGCIVK